MSGERLQKLDARLRARELKRRAQGQLHPRLLVDPLDPRVKIIGPYKF
ncbi:MAG: hypothetical protein ACRESV_11425 [Nevskiales bacterium]